MDTTTSPPLTPIQQYMTSPIDTSPSPTHSFRNQLRRRTSSFSSNNDRSPVTPQSRHRFSNGSQLSAEFGLPADGGGGLGNLADELGHWEDDEEFEEGDTEHVPAEEAGKDEASRDSGIDVSYQSSAKMRNFSKPFQASQDNKPPDEWPAEMDEPFSPELEGLIASVHRMTSCSDATEDPLIPRTVTQLQNLGNQNGLEAGIQRLATSTNSMSAHLMSQSKSLQTLAQSLYPMFALSAPIDPSMVEEIIPLVEELVKNIPHPDFLPAQKLQKLNRETGDVMHALSQITDTLQMGRQITTAAARHLQVTQTMVTELRREREKAELARHELDRGEWEERVQQRWCGAQCADIIAGFEDQCNSLRGTLEAAINAGA